MNQFSYIDNLSNLQRQKMQNNILKNPETYIQKNMVVIDSRDRNRDIFPSTSNFAVKFNNSSDGNISVNFRNIESIELNQVIVPQSVINGTTGVPYLILEIDEIRDTIYGTNTNLRNAFAFLSPQDVYGSKFLSCKFYKPAIKIFEAPLASLHKFSIKLKKPDGTIFNFGTDNNNNNPVNDDIQTTFFFTINTIEAKHRNISIAR